MNNNDQWPTYNVADAELNWDFLGAQTKPITPANVRTHFARWARTPQRFEDPNGGKWCQPPGEWNYYGGNSWWLHSDDQPTTITGVQYDVDGEVHHEATDPLMGAVLDMFGDAYPGSDFPTAPRMLDINPDATWNTSFLARGLQVGTKTAPQRLIRGTVAPGTWMSSRWLHFGRNLNLSGKVWNAGVGGSVQQTCLPKESLYLAPGQGSAALDALAAGLRSDDVRGLMVRFTAYLTLYFTGSVFADLKNATLTERYARLAQLWQDQISTGEVPLQNPAVSRIVGSIGLWSGDEHITVPGGRYLAPCTTTSIEVPKERKVWLGCTALETHTRGSKVFASIDLGNTVPELDENGAKVPLGDLKLLLERDGTNEARTVATLPQSGYDTEHYEKKAGIVDLELDATAPELATGDQVLVLVRETAAGQDRLLVEQRLTAWAENRGLYVEQGATNTLTIEVRDRGKLPEDTVYVLLQQYVPTPRQPAPGDFLKRAAPDEELVSFRKEPGEKQTGLLRVRDGRATVTFDSVRPGFPVVAFFPYFENDTPPTPPDVLPPFGAPQQGFNSAYYSSIRVMPFDDDLPAQFQQVLDISDNDRDAAWQFVYERILYLYDALYPIMRYYGSLDLGEQKSVEQNIDQIVRLCEPDMLDSTLYMPASRDLSNGKRTVLKMYRDLVLADE